MMARDAALPPSALFDGLGPDEREAVLARMRARTFEAGETLCRAGDPSDRIWVVTGGLVSWSAAATEGGEELNLRMRKGDVIGAQDALTGKERSTSVVASTRVTTLELDAADLQDLGRAHPQILINVIQTQRERLMRAAGRSASVFSASVRSTAGRRGEEIGLIAGHSLAGLVPRLVAAARTASVRPVTFLDRSLSFAGALTASDEAATEDATVLIAGDLDPENVKVMLEEVDRVVALAGNAEEAELLGRVAAEVEGAPPEVVLVSEEARRASTAWSRPTLDLIVRACARAREDDYPLADEDLAWLARHLTRTKLGIALGAGGAKGYAHVGMLQVLEGAGYTIDYAGGSSIGGFVATHVALGYDADEINERFRRAFSPDLLARMFSSPLGAGAAGAAALEEMLKEATGQRFFSQTVIPLVVMAVDLTERMAKAQRTGPLWDALLAALSVAGVFPVRERDEHRLVDAIAMVPVPTPAVLEDGADVVVAVNLLGAETLERWPGQPEPDPDAAPPVKKRRGALDTMLEVMDLSQLDTAARYAALADVAITPRFGPADWRDFGSADLFLEAGRRAAEEQLPALQALCRPVDLEAARREAAVV